MKKLMFAAIAAALVTVSQAASIQWKLTNQNPSPFASLTAYIVSASDYNDAITDLTTNDGGKFMDTYSVTTSAKGLNARGGGSGGAQLKDGDNQFAIFLFKDGIVDGKTYYTTGLIGGSSYLYTPPEQATSTLDLGTASAAFTTTGTIAKSGGSEGVPEPTSGLLFLVGGAMLALRRKQK